MVEGNSYTLAIVIILGLVAIFLIYWFAIRNKSGSNVNVQQQEGYENEGDGNGEEDDEDLQENFEVRMSKKDEDKKRFSDAQNYPPSLDAQ